MSMENWNAFVKHVLLERPDKADKGEIDGDKLAFANNLTPKKEKKEEENEQ